MRLIAPREFPLAATLCGSSGVSPRTLFLPLVQRCPPPCPHYEFPFQAFLFPVAHPISNHFLLCFLFRFFKPVRREDSGFLSLTSYPTITFYPSVPLSHPQFHLGQFFNPFFVSRFSPIFFVQIW